MSETDLAFRPVAGTVRMLLRAEGLAELAVLVGLFAGIGGNWYLFAALFFAPDVSFLGYLLGPRAGAAIYNAAHLLLFPALLGGASALCGWPLALSLAVIWAAHIQFDRALGYGLKYPGGFGETHLGRIGKAA